MSVFSHLWYLQNIKLKNNNPSTYLLISAEKNYYKIKTPLHKTTIKSFENTVLKIIENTVTCFPLNTIN